LPSSASPHPAVPEQQTHVPPGAGRGERDAVPPRAEFIGFLECGISPPAGCRSWSDRFWPSRVIQFGGLESQLSVGMPTWGSKEPLGVKQSSRHVEHRASKEGNTNNATAAGVWRWPLRVANPVTRFSVLFRTDKKKAPGVSAKCLIHLPNLVGA
jgi:hypothetical protein